MKIPAGAFVFLFIVFICRGRQAWSTALGLGPSLIEVRGFKSPPLHLFSCFFLYLFKDVVL